MPSVGGKKFAYSLGGIQKAQQELQSLGQQREADALEEQKKKIRASRQRQKQKGPVRKALRDLGYIQGRIVPVTQ